MSGERTLITGGAGFVGTNLADRLLRSGRQVVVFDDLSRAGVRENLRWLQDTHHDGLFVHVEDVRDARALRRALVGVDQVFHLAAQVAVTTSVDDPLHDFSVNLAGTLTLLEELRGLKTPPPMLFTSTNKVYGRLQDVKIRLRGSRYEPADDGPRLHGIGGDRALQFCSPYGCSKGGADQYVLDYAQTFDLPAMVLRMSCIYGPHQHGNEDQGWVAHFLMQAVAGDSITLYGDGQQVRDILFIDDLLDAMDLAVAGIDRLKGQAFNIGGGMGSAVSLLEVIDLIGKLEGHQPEVAYGPWRVGDQRWYVSDTRAFSAATGWRARTGVAQGLQRLHGWFQTAGPRLSVAEAI